MRGVIGASGGRWLAGGIVAAALGLAILQQGSLPAAQKADKGKVVGLCGHWSMDEGRGDSVGDASRYQLAGKFRGAPAWIAGKRGKALSFNGVNDCITLGNPQHLQFAGTITLAAWIRPRATDGFRNIIAHGYTTKSEVVLRVEDGKYSISSWDGANTHAATTPVVEGDLGQWVHLAGVYDGKMWKIFRNGELAQVALNKIGALEVEGDWAIGGKANADERYFSGDIDDVRIYSRGLSDKEVDELAAERDAPVQAGTTKRPPVTVGKTPVPPSQPLVVDSPPTTTKSAIVPAPSGKTPATAAEFLLRGIARQAAHDPAGAADDFTRVIELDPKLLPKAMIRRACAHWAARDLVSALNDCEVALAQHPDDAQAWLVRAQIKAESGDSSGAIKDLEQGTAKLTAGAEPGVFNLRAGVLAHLGRKADALSAYRQAAKQEKAGEEIDRAQWGIWVTRARQGEHLEACDDLKKYLDGRQGDEDWFRSYGAFLAGDLTEARLFEEARKFALKQGSGSVLVQAHYHAGLKRLFTGDRQGARDQFQAGAVLAKKQGRPVEEFDAELARLKQAD